WTPLYPLRPKSLSVDTPVPPWAPALSVWTPLFPLRPSSLSVDTPVSPCTPALSVWTPLYPPAPQLSQCGHPCLLVNLSGALCFPECWRISFSHVEKEIFKNHGSSKTCCESYAKNCCRKKALRLLKCLIEGLKQRHPRELAQLCSYHGKTVFLHTLSRHGDDAIWAPRRLPSCFLLLLDSFIAHVQCAELPHFFISASNMFAPAAFPRRSLLFLQGALEEQRQSGVPLFQVSSPSRLLPADPPGPSSAPSCPPVCSSGLHFPSLPWGLGALALLTTLLVAAALVLH
uniref:Mab-21-like HhH/H2TH-like domain-containing protein n=1 Tax=Lepisosteus oculatus TaxID=7918 RepID=W5LY27_LEPOC